MAREFSSTLCGRDARRRRRSSARSGTQARARFIVPLGVGAHLERWGVAPDRITELDWGESTTVTSWASRSVAGPTHRIFHSGDTGPFPGIADIGATYGPFDVTFVKIGAYGEAWPHIHLTSTGARSISPSTPGTKPPSVWWPRRMGARSSSCRNRVSLWSPRPRGWSSRGGARCVGPWRGRYPRSGIIEPLTARLRPLRRTYPRSGIRYRRSLPNLSPPPAPDDGLLHSGRPVS